MIAASSYYWLKAGKVDGLDLDVVPGLKLAQVDRDRTMFKVKN